MQQLSCSSATLHQAPLSHDWSRETLFDTMTSPQHKNLLHKSWEKRIPSASWRWSDDRRRRGEEIDCFVARIFSMEWWWVRFRWSSNIKFIFTPHGCSLPVHENMHGLKIIPLFSKYGNGSAWSGLGPVLRNLDIRRAVYWVGPLDGPFGGDFARIS